MGNYQLNSTVGRDQLDKIFEKLENFTLFVPSDGAMTTWEDQVAKMVLSFQYCIFYWKVCPRSEKMLEFFFAEFISIFCYLLVSNDSAIFF